MGCFSRHLVMCDAMRLTAPSSSAAPSSRLGLIASLTAEDNERSKNCLSLLSDTNQFIRQIKVPRQSDSTFVVDGIPFHTRTIPNGEQSRLVIWCTLGYLPYSVTSSEKRKALITILESLVYSRDVRFGVDGHLMIVASASFNITHPPAADYIFFPLIQFLQRARPFIRLIGDYL